MTTPVRVCRHCQEAITDPEANGMIVAHELGNSGPGGIFGPTVITPIWST